MAQHDYSIANGTGSAVRSDLNNALAAIVSMNSGSTEPSTTFAFQFWADTNANLLKMRNSANDGWIELRQLDGEFTNVSVANGTAAAPSIFFNASGTDTGIYSAGTDSVDVSTGGTRRLAIGSGGDVTVLGGNVTLNAQGDLRLADSDSSNWVAFQAPATVASNVTWTLPSADGSNGQALTTNGSGTLTWTSAGGASITTGNTTAEVVDTGSDGHFKVTTEGTEALRIDASQRHMFGTSSDLSSNARAIFAGKVSGSDGQIEIRRAGATPSAGTTIGSIKFSDGNASSGHYADILVAADADSGSGADLPGRIVFQTTSDGASSPTERMRIDSNGLTKFSSKSGSTSSPDTISMGSSYSSTAGTNIKIRTYDDGSGNYNGIGHSASTFDISAGVSGHNITFYTNGGSGATDRAVIDSTGRLNLSTASQAGSFTRSASLRVLSGVITQNADFEMGNTGYTSTMIHVACERTQSGSYNFIDLFSGRRYNNSAGDRETSLQGDGNNYCDGSWSGGGADYAEMFEWSDANPDAEDRRGLSVVLDGDKIREAVAGEDPIGVISGNPSVVGDTAWNKWSEKYLSDDFGSYQKETYSLTEWEDENGETQSYESDRIPADVTVPDDAVIKTVDDAGATLTRRILNPNYDPDVAYVPRKERAEWDPVGLMGKLRIRKGQVTGARWIKMRDISDTVEEWLVR